MKRVTFDHHFGNSLLVLDDVMIELGDIEKSGDVLLRVTRGELEFIRSEFRFASFDQARRGEKEKLMYQDAERIQKELSK